MFVCMYNDIRKKTSYIKKLRFASSEYYNILKKNREDSKKLLC